MNTVPTLAELDCEAVLAAGVDLCTLREGDSVPVSGKASDPLPAFPKPDWVKAREPKQKRVKKRIGESVPNPCTCRDYAATGQANPARKHAKTAYELCANGPTLALAHGCQIYQLFRIALLGCKHPADYVLERHRFEPTEDDREHIEWVCWTNVQDWLFPGEVAMYGKAAIVEADLMEFLRAYRASYEAHVQEQAKTCPPMAAFLAARKAGHRAAAERAIWDLRWWERREGMKRIGMRPEAIEEWIAKDQELEQRNRFGHTDAGN